MSKSAQRLSLRRQRWWLQREPQNPLRSKMETAMSWSAKKKTMKSMNLPTRSMQRVTHTHKK
eukprot:6457428-Amphidinium_carterae.1